MRRLLLRAGLLVALTACGAATGIDVGPLPVDGGADVDAARPVDDGALAGCESCSLPRVCVTRSDPGAPSVSRPYECVAEPAACDGVVSCTCAASLCRDERCIQATSTPYRAIVTCFAP